MNRILTTFALLLAVATLHASNEFKEDFENGLPSSAPSSETTVALASGSWRLKGVMGKKDNGSLRATMTSAGAWLVTPALCQPGVITLKHRASGNGKKLLVEKSTDGGESWTELGVSTLSSSTPYGSSTFNANSSEADSSVLVRFTCQAATIYLDDITITLNSVSGGGDDPYPGNPEPQDTIEWSGPHSVEHCIYVAPWGGDNGDGTWEHPYYNLQMAVDKTSAGDTIYVRGGTYYPTMKKDGTKTTVRLNKSGSPEAWYTIKTFPGEFPILNFRDQPKKQSVRGIQLDGDYWHIYGLHVTEAGDNGMKVEGSHNIIERCTFSYNDDTGLQLGFGHQFSDSHPGVSSNDGSYCAYNDVVDCDSYLNYDTDNRGSDADGFACKMHNGKGNRFIRCRAWHNSDDAWDLYETDFGVKLIECWAWGSGREEDFGWAGLDGGSFQGNGNGIKLGGNGSGGSSKGVHEAWRCVAFNCNKTGSVKGFDENSHKGGVMLVNCLAFGNGYDYMFEDCASAATFSFYNNVCLGRIEVKGTFTDSHNAMSSETKNAWKNNVLTSGFSEADYVSLTEEDAMAPRAIDGSLPTRFARLKSNSVLIDKGLDMKNEMQDEFPFTWQEICGAGRDLGPYEYEGGAATGAQMLLKRATDLELTLCQGNIVFSVPSDGKVVVDVLNAQGMGVTPAICLLAAGGAEYSFPAPQLPGGVYFARLTHRGMSRTMKMVVR
ncbi:MAG: right-handed parallel beta-helix repeat-containing protein [Prevotella sp.]|nr:right-handed parallel beta-helix repeat-containing protein [Prevotella sp.]